MNAQNIPPKQDPGRAANPPITTPPLLPPPQTQSRPLMALVKFFRYLAFRISRIGQAAASGTFILSSYVVASKPEANRTAANAQPPNANSGRMPIEGVAGDGVERRVVGRAAAVAARRGRVDTVAAVHDDALSVPTDGAAGRKAIARAMAKGRKQRGRERRGYESSAARARSRCTSKGGEQDAQAGRTGGLGGRGRRARRGRAQLVGGVRSNRAGGRSGSAPPARRLTAAWTSACSPESRARWVLELHPPPSAQPGSAYGRFVNYLSSST